MDRETSVLFRSITIIFKTFGLLPFAISSHPKSKRVMIVSPSRITVAYNVLFLGGLIYVNCFIGIPFIIKYCEGKVQDTQIILDILHTIVTTVVSLIILVTFCARRVKIMAMSREFLEIDRHIRKRQHLQPPKFPVRPLLVFIVLYIINWIVLVTTEWREDFVAAPKMSLIPWGGTYLVPVAVITLCVLQYAVIMKLAAFRFLLLNHMLRKSMNGVTDYSQENRTFVLSESAGVPLVVRKFRSIKDAHESLYDFTISVSHFYSVLILPIIGYFCGTFIFLSFDFIMNIFLSTNPANTISNFICWMLMIISPMVVLLSNIEAATEEYERTPVELYKLASRFSSSRVLVTEVELFSHDFLHKKMNFSALGCFTLDYTVLQSIFSTTLTYLIIIFQFQESRRMAAKKSANKTCT